MEHLSLDALKRIFPVVLQSVECNGEAAVYESKFVTPQTNQQPPDDDQIRINHSVTGLRCKVCPVCSRQIHSYGG